MQVLLTVFLLVTYHNLSVQTGDMFACSLQLRHETDGARCPGSTSS